MFLTKSRHRFILGPALVVLHVVLFLPLLIRRQYRQPDLSPVDGGSFAPIVKSQPQYSVPLACFSFLVIFVLRQAISKAWLPKPGSRFERWATFVESSWLFGFGVGEELIRWTIVRLIESLIGGEGGYGGYKDGIPGDWTWKDVLDRGGVHGIWESLYLYGWVWGSLESATAWHSYKPRARSAKRQRTGKRSSTKPNTSQAKKQSKRRALSERLRISKIHPPMVISETEPLLSGSTMRTLPRQTSPNAPIMEHGNSKRSLFSRGQTLVDERDEFDGDRRRLRHWRATGSESWISNQGATRGYVRRDPEEVPVLGGSGLDACSASADEDDMTTPRPGSSFYPQRSYFSSTSTAVADTEGKPEFDELMKPAGEPNLLSAESADDEDSPSSSQDEDTEEYDEDDDDHLREHRDSIAISEPRTSTSTHHEDEHDMPLLSSSVPFDHKLDFPELERHTSSEYMLPGAHFSQYSGDIEATASQLGNYGTANRSPIRMVDPSSEYFSYQHGYLYGADHCIPVEGAHNSTVSEANEESTGGSISSRMRSLLTRIRIPVSRANTSPLTEPNNSNSATGRLAADMVYGMPKLALPMLYPVLWRASAVLKHLAHSLVFAYFPFPWHDSRIQWASIMVLLAITIGKGYHQIQWQRGKIVERNRLGSATWVGAVLSLIAYLLALYIWGLFKRW